MGKRLRNKGTNTVDCLWISCPRSYTTHTDNFSSGCVRCSCLCIPYSQGPESILWSAILRNDFLSPWAFYLYWLALWLWLRQRITQEEMTDFTCTYNSSIHITLLTWNGRGSSHKAEVVLADKPEKEWYTEGISTPNLSYLPHPLPLLLLFFSKCPKPLILPFSESCTFWLCCPHKGLLSYDKCECTCVQ